MESKLKRILVVDDEQSIRDILSKMLSVIGFEVVVAGTGDEGLDLFQDGPFDLVITDLEMPGMDGWTLTSRIKGDSPDTPVLIITGSSKVHVVREMKEPSANSVMIKPFRLAELKRTVQRLLSEAPQQQ
jgi:CheY-like chemotaxis protein